MYQYVIDITRPLKKKKKPTKKQPPTEECVDTIVLLLSVFLEQYIYDFSSL